MDITPREGGGCRVQATWDRTAAGPRGWLMLGFLALGWNRFLRLATRKSLADLAERLDQDTPDGVATWSDRAAVALSARTTPLRDHLRRARGRSC